RGDGRRRVVRRLRRGHLGEAALRSALRRFLRRRCRNRRRLRDAARRDRAVRLPSGAGCARRRRRDCRSRPRARAGLGVGDARRATSLTTFSASFAVLATVRLFEGRWGRFDREGVAMAVVALVEGAVAVFFFRREGRRELSVLHSGLALTVVAIAAADLLSGAN